MDTRTPPSATACHSLAMAIAVALGTAMPFLGLATAVITTRIHRAEGDTGGEAFLIVSCFDMLAFAITFGLAVFWRRRPEYHRRLMVMASSGLTAAAFARLPDWLMPRNAWYLGVDALLLTAVLMDWAVLRRVHPVHRYGVPLLMVGQATAMWIYTTNAQFWLPIARALLA